MLPCSINPQLGDWYHHVSPRQRDESKLCFLLLHFQSSCFLSLQPLPVGCAGLFGSDRKEVIKCSRAVTLTLPCELYLPLLHRAAGQSGLRWPLGEPWALMGLPGRKVESEPRPEVRQILTSLDFSGGEPVGRDIFFSFITHFAVSQAVSSLKTLYTHFYFIFIF